jgi:coenzyme F420-reducing hydrogenase gamma subunit
MPKETIQILTRLQDVHAMSNDHFRRVHHFILKKRSKTTINVHLGYCGRLGGFSGQTNVRTRERLRIVLEEKDGGADWETAIAAALKRYPLP